jgi:diguanylate cyclase (GGDEF)-like protein
VARGSVIPLTRGVPATGSAAGELLDGESLAALGPANWVAAPLDAADGRVVGVLLATGAEGVAPPRQVAQLLLVGARLLSYEWESISSRAELRRLAELARDRASTDPVTGLPNRETLLAAIEREWELSKRGTVESYVVVCHVREREALIERHGEAMANLLLKDVAEVLGGAIRRTDYLARISPDGLTAVLVGCKGPEGALAFLGRAERALERVTEGRPANLQLSYGIQRLADAGSTNEALELAEISARAAPARRNGTPLSAGPATGAA